MAIFICTIEGVRGRTLHIYDTKVEIDTRVTVGSVLTDNATDGEKTIFLKDVVGVQFKRSGLAIGYLQFETPSMQMNNRGDNFFSENTFTFGEKANYLMEKIRDFLVDRIEEYKYTGTAAPIEDAITDELLSAMKREKLHVNSRFLTDLEKQRAKQAAEERAQAQQEHEEQLAARRAEIAAMGDEDPLKKFLAEAELCSRLNEVVQLWKNYNFPSEALYNDVQAKLEENQKMERMYGKGAVNVAKTLASIRGMME